VYYESRGVAPSHWDRLRVPVTIWVDVGLEGVFVAGIDEIL